MAVSRLSIGKLLELLITLACLGLHYNSLHESDPHTIILASGTFFGFTIILIGLFAGYILSTPINKRIDIFFSLLGCILFIATGALIISEWKDASTIGVGKFQINLGDSDTKKLAMTKGSLAIVNGILFFFDVVFTFRD